jgi:predicted AlkP superfamily pyrophosphatase or phosphodiesterase
MDHGKSVVLFLVDSMRPDGLLKAETPTLDRLIASGSHSLTCRSVFPSKTLPCHASLFFTVDPDVHGIVDNVWSPVRCDAPSLFDVLKANGMKAASFYNWEPLRDLSRPESLEASFFVRDSYDCNADPSIADLASAYLRENPVHFAFVYLHHTDAAGHREGWMSEAYLRAISGADRCIGRVIENLGENTITMVTADHGGHEKSHGTELDEDMLVPLIVSGPGISSGRRLEGSLKITDLAPTILRSLGMAAPPQWVGRAIEFE